MSQSQSNQEYVNQIEEIEVVPRLNAQTEWVSAKIFFTFSRKFDSFFGEALSNKKFIIMFNIYHIFLYCFLIVISILGILMIQAEGILLNLLFFINSVFSTLNLSFHAFDLVMKFRQEFRYVYSVPGSIYILLIVTKVIAMSLLIYIDVEVFKLGVRIFFIILTIILALNFVVIIIQIGFHILFYILIAFSFLIELFIRLLLCRLTHPSPNRTIRFFQNRENTNVQINLKAEIFKYDAENVIACIICMENLKDEDKIVRLNCHKNHIFHFKCLHEWSKSKGICPNCRSPL